MSVCPYVGLSAVLFRFLYLHLIVLIIEMITIYIAITSVGVQYCDAFITMCQLTSSSYVQPSWKGPKPLEVKSPK